MIFGSNRVERSAQLLLQAVERCRRRRIPRGAADAARLQRHLLARRQARRLRGVRHAVHRPVARDQRVAALPRRTHASDSRHEPGRLFDREAAVDGQQRFRSDVDRQHGLLPVRSQSHAERLLVPDRHEAAQAAHASRRLRHHDRVGWARRRSSTSRRVTSTSSMRRPGSRSSSTSKSTAICRGRARSFKRVAA